MTAVVCKVDIHLWAIQSLKQKRGILRKIMARLEQKFGVIVSEVDHQDLLQRSALGFSYIGTDPVLLNRLADETLRYIDETGLAETLGSEREVIHL